MKILVTNDDGIYAPGLITLATYLHQSHDVCVVAPQGEQSGVGHGITVHHPLRLRKVTLPRGERIEAYSVSGTPADCVKMAFDALMEQPPDLVVSGINAGVNLGTDVLYSGTVSAAIEAAILGASAIAVSLDGDDRESYELAARYTEQLGCEFISHGTRSDILLNVNVPSLQETAIRGVRPAQLGLRRYEDVFHRRSDPRGRDYFWLAGDPIDVDIDSAESDAASLRDGYITLTPIHYDLTAYHVLEEMKEWNLTTKGGT